MSPPKDRGTKRQPGPTRGRESGPAEEWREPIPRLREPRYSQSVERGLAILECFTPERPVRGIAELADELGMSRSTTHRYALTLTALGYLVRASGRRYRLGLRVTHLGLGAMGATSLRQHARPHLEELARRAPYTLAIFVLDGPEALCVDCVHPLRLSQRPLRAVLHRGARLPAHRTAAGKLLVAHLPEREQREVLAELIVQRRGPAESQAAGGRAALRRELATIVEEGLARSEGELGEGLCEIAAPVRSQTGEVYTALSMTAHGAAISLAQLERSLGPHLVSTADRISAQLGFRREDERR